MRAKNGEVQQKLSTEVIVMRLNPLLHLIGHIVNGYLVVLPGFTLQCGGHVQTDGLNSAEESGFRPMLDDPLYLQCQLLVILDRDGLCRVPGTVTGQA